MDGLEPVSQRAPGRWQIGTVTEVKPETPQVKTFRLELPMWIWCGRRGHIDTELIAQADSQARIIFICGSNGFVEAASGLALAAGFDRGTIRTERFGPTG